MKKNLLLLVTFVICLINLYVACKKFNKETKKSSSNRLERRFKCIQKNKKNIDPFIKIGDEVICI